MMRPSRTRAVLLGLTVLLVALPGARGSGEQSLPDAGSIIAVACNTFEKVHQAGAPLPMLMAIANRSDRPVFVPKFDHPSIKVHDAEGRAVMGDPLLTPPPPPGDWYMQRGDKQVLMTPVWRLESGGGVVVVVPNALKCYSKSLAKGTYYLSLNVHSLAVYQEDEVVRREEMPDKEWVEAGPAENRQMSVNTNSVEITIE